MSYWHCIEDLHTANTSCLPEPHFEQFFLSRPISLGSNIGISKIQNETPWFQANQTNKKTALVSFPLSVCFRLLTEIGVAFLVIVPRCVFCSSAIPIAGYTRTDAELASPSIILVIDVAMR